jgi:hypothetical protein
MVELADTQDLESCAERYVGSNPSMPTIGRMAEIGLRRPVGIRTQ